jgi:hypothetical protein
MFQLTPLLDLLLIVIFAQYMDVRQTGARQQQWFDNEKQQIEVEANAQAEKEAELRRQAEIELAFAEDQINSLKKMRNVDDELIQDLKNQRQLLAEFVNQALKVSPEMVDQMLSKSKLADDENFRETVKQLREAAMGEALQTAVSYHELLKRCDIWEFFLADAAGENASRLIFRSNGDREEWTVRDLPAFQRKLKADLRARPQPKSLVIVLSGFLDEELTRGQRDDFRRLLDDTFQELTVESGGQTRYYYRDLGYLGELDLNLQSGE